MYNEHLQNTPYIVLLIEYPMYTVHYDGTLYIMMDIIQKEQEPWPVTEDGNVNNV